MKFAAIIYLALVSFAFSGYGEGEAPIFLTPEAPIPLPPGFDVYFGPATSLEDRVVEAINRAEAEILVNAYALTSHKILNAIMDAYVRRKLFVVVLMDPKPSVTRYTTPEYFQLNGLPYAFPKLETGFNNQNYIVIDKKGVITGSYQFTTSGRRDTHESLMAIYEPSVAVQFYNHFIETLNTSVMPQSLKEEGNE